MKLTGLHLLLTYKCIYECDHCFVWGSPRQSGTMTTRTIDLALQQAAEIDTVEWVYFEGGEPFLYYPVLQAAVASAKQNGFKVGIVTNAYWAIDEADAERWLRPFESQVEDLSISGDLYHGDEIIGDNVTHAVKAAGKLGIPTNVITIGQPGEGKPESTEAPTSQGSYRVIYRGRAASALAGQAEKHAWDTFTECDGENLREPGRLHLDPFGELHICQGISIGNILRTPLKQLCASYDPDTHPVVGPLLEGGPARLVGRYGLAHEGEYADACHLCYEARRALRDRLPQTLTPDSMYGSPSK